MDTIRTVYVESQFADKLRDGSYVMNIPGTLSVPDGSRAYVDNISFTNIFSSSIDETNDELYVQTDTIQNGLDPSNTSFTYVVSGKQLEPLYAGEYDIKQRKWLPRFQDVRFQDQFGATVNFRTHSENLYEFVLPVSVRNAAATNWNIGGQSVTIIGSDDDKAYEYQNQSGQTRFYNFVN